LRRTLGQSVPAEKLKVTTSPPICIISFIRFAMSKVNIRRATTNDAAAVAKLSGTLGYPVEAEAMARRLAGILAQETHAVFVVEAAGEVVGWIHGAEQEMLEFDRRCEILGLVVDASQRGQGVGRRLVEAVEDWARTRGLNDVSVRSNVIRPESHPFYERIGYVRVKTQHAYRKRLRDTGFETRDSR
jgi:GNAT superfamily N-acetyltransferase